MTATTTQNTATERQNEFIKKLAAERTADPRTEAILAIARDLYRRGLFTKEAASDVIELLLEVPHDEKPETAKAPAPEGMHLLRGDTSYGTAAIYKVQIAVHGSGKPYAKKLTPVRECEGHTDTDGPMGYTNYCDGSCRPLTEATWSFEYAPGAIKELSEDTLMSAEDAKAFGAIYGTCCVCGRTLTNENSIAAGIGPICANSF